MKKVTVALSAAGAGAMALAMLLGSGVTWACCVYGDPPVITAINADPDTLWPPNHKMVEIILDVQGTDIEEWYVSDVSTQDLGPGAGDPGNDPDFDGIGTQYLSLRAERSGAEGGRAYNVQVTATNDYGQAVSNTTVVVPHDMGK